MEIEGGFSNQIPRDLHNIYFHLFEFFELNIGDNKICWVRVLKKGESQKI